MRIAWLAMIACGLALGCMSGDDGIGAGEDWQTGRAGGIDNATTQPVRDERFAHCPPAEHLTDRTGWQQARGTYRAEQSGKTVILHASGEHPRAGYETKLAMNLTKIYPPQFTLHAKPPEGPSATMMTPFETCVQFPADGPVKTVIVFDAAGRHEVPVQQLP